MVIYLVQLALFVSLEAFETKTLFVFPHSQLVRHASPVYFKSYLSLACGWAVISYHYI
jgi:hypothetical protein